MSDVQSIIVVVVVTVAVAVRATGHPFRVVLNGGGQSVFELFYFQEGVLLLLLRFLVGILEAGLCGAVHHRRR